MKRSRLALLAGALWLLPAGMAAAQPTPITNCYTTITQSGSYVLTHDLNCIPTSGDGITIATTATHVTIDLGGFALIGNAQNRYGIVGGDYTSVSNGTIKGWGTGVSTGQTFTMYRGLTVAGSNRGGAGAGTLASILADSRFIDNGGSGFGTGGTDGGTVFVISDCSFSGNGGGGFVANTDPGHAGGIVSGSNSWGNGIGFNTATNNPSPTPVIYTNNAAADNFSVSCPTVMVDNSASSSSSFPAGCALKDNIP